jgi:hypothetical protein
LVEGATLVNQKSGTAAAQLKTVLKRGAMANALLPQRLLALRRSQPATAVLCPACAASACRA